MNLLCTLSCVVSLVVSTSCSMFAASVEAEAHKATDQFFSVKRDLSITRDQFFQAATFILDELPAYVDEKIYYIAAETSELAHAIQYDPEHDLAFIILNNDKDYIARGNKKRVYKSILFDVAGSEVVARAIQFTPMDTELKTTRMVQGAPGLFATYAICFHTDGVNKYKSIYSHLYKPGAFAKKLLKKKVFSLYEKATIFRGILQGLDSLHSLNLVHRDLNVNNFLIDIPAGRKGKRDIQAVIADLGRTRHINDAKHVPAQGARRFIPPEGYFLECMEGKDYFASDIYAVGCVFYHLFYEKEPSWQNKKILKDRSISNWDKFLYLVKKKTNETQKRRLKLEKKKSKKRLSPNEELEYLILTMIRTNPAKRGSARELLAEVERIRTRLN